MRSGARSQKLEVIRMLDAPIVWADTHPEVGPNIQGPSLIRVPDWVDAAFGNYYLYFADHKGSYIRFAYADDLTGPWRVHAPGSLQLDESHFPTRPPDAPPEAIARIREAAMSQGMDFDTFEHDIIKELTAPHIASPDVHIDEINQRIVMYFHGLEALGRQLTRVATSRDGIHFEAGKEILGRTYWRAFEYGGYVYGLAMPGQFYRSENPLGGFEAGPVLFNPDMRHAAVLLRGDLLYVFWTQVGHAPERILLSTIDLSPPWDEWRESAPVEVLRPERSWEGADAPLEASVRSVAYGGVNQLRDPAIYEEGGKVYLLYAVAGESGIAIAELKGID
ncbi:MAG: hypothetical protein QF921_18465 [Pseudomonadales bacterium]|jgi:hypothetical protein|nr:hypothetical protein [Pseudomonadales bacterium]MDP6472347.1 hypothetical protein [Pseudomonadales bacterium]MDP6828143.1 hypothetical protein [Pseudomonadales bacterium]MDP6973472.1 hypothetical protein [Pseudomonadales bacterium]|tara:strand:+ start:3245 stop:4249 length:1005 start_codon:yes stop_codon:yes gene_type:complete